MIIRTRFMARCPTCGALGGTNVEEWPDRETGRVKLVTGCDYPCGNLGWDPLLWRKIGGRLQPVVSRQRWQDRRHPFLRRARVLMKIMDKRDARNHRLVGRPLPDYLKPRRELPVYRIVP